MLILLTLSLALITTGCVSNDVEITLPPQPQRSEQTSPHTLKEYAHLVVYYEYLLQEWEQWGEDVTNIVENKKKEKK